MGLTNEKVGKRRARSPGTWAIDFYIDDRMIIGPRVHTMRLSTQGARTSYRGNTSVYSS
jgi:hypothetical protein